MATKTFDPKCYELAAIFLGDVPELHTEDRINELAALIQQTIEHYVLECRMKPLSASDLHAIVTKRR